MLRWKSAITASALALALPHRPALAQTERVFGYAAAKVYPAAVRFLRVDERLRLVEKDADAGYVLFELKEERKVFPGALELIPVDDEGGARVRVVLRIEDRPSYLEAAMLERFERKLRSELGSPPPRKTKKEPPKDPAPKDPPKNADEPAPDAPKLAE